MKKAALVLAAFMALSGTAFAGQAQPAKQVSTTACMQTKSKTKLDCASTGSVEKAGDTHDSGPRLGIDINPWIVPTNF
jgi:hypothetical protein